MKTNGNDKSLESYRVFPIVAWTLTFGFALFVYNITQDLKEIALSLEEQSNHIKQNASKPVEEIEDFSR